MEILEAQGFRLERNAERIRLVRERREVLSFDPVGRPLALLTGSFIYRRALDGRMLRIHRVGEEPYRFHRSRWLGPDQARERLERVRARVEEAWEALGHPEALRPPREIDLERDARRFLEIYRPVGILPPDQYRALVLQLTTGCSYNRCTFCTFYRGERFRVRSPEEFARHLCQARHFFGAGLAWRRGIFLGEGNAANLSTRRLVEALDWVSRWFGGDPHFQTVGAFLDTFSGRPRPVREWEELRRRGLTHLYLGVESGSRSVLELVRKPEEPERVVALVEDLKQAGIRLGVIVMAGVGGRRLAAEHVAETARLLNRLPLGRDDRIYVSEFLEPPADSEYAQRAAARGLDSLSREECRDQVRSLRARLRFPPYPQGPAVTLYDVRQFVY